MTTPDLIIVLDHDSGEPITTEGLRYGQRVRVIAAPSDARWHSAEALAMVGPRLFRLRHPVTPFRRHGGGRRRGGTVQNGAVPNGAAEVVA